MTWTASSEQGSLEIRHFRKRRDSMGETERKQKQPPMTKEELRRDIALARSERYYRTAYFIQSKWFMVGGGLAIAIFLILIFLLG